MTAGRIGWVVLGLLTLASAIAVSFRFGVGTIVAALIFFVVPWMPWKPLRSAWFPLSGLVVLTVWPVWPPLFGAGLGWLTGIAAVRVLRGPDELRDGPAGPGRLGFRVLGLDLAPDRSLLGFRGKPGPQAGRASIPRPEPVNSEPEPRSSPSSSPSEEEPPSGEPGPANGPAPSQRAAEQGERRPHLRPPANRQPRAASKPEPRQVPKPGSGRHARPDSGPESGTGR
ncbi:hypothetical protein AB0M02_35120 [Actinoplanes sp. NPDC051861]|uniref:hypothetical protein n=1 Tax=Actinoplanes sp. NPDC051861 TaxID=3155170 RepID=UPI00342329B1